MICSDFHLCCGQNLIANDDLLSFQITNNIFSFINFVKVVKFVAKSVERKANFATIMLLIAAFNKKTRLLNHKKVGFLMLSSLFSPFSVVS